MALPNGRAFSRVYGSQSARVRLQKLAGGKNQPTKSWYSFDCVPKGKLGRFDLGALVLVFITGGGLMTAARMFIELMSTTFGPEAARHRRALTDDVDLAHLD